VQIHVPPLRERQKDLEALSRLFVKTYAAKHGSGAKKISAEALRFLKNYDFPGNVRELANIIERAVVIADGAGIEVVDLPEGLRAAAAQRGLSDRRPTLSEIEADYIRATLVATKGNKTEAARILGISRKNLYERLARMENDETRDQKSEVRSH
jgi:DNA-binding NtrC family response regulator